MNSTFSSLSSASLSASTFSVDAVSLASRATATSSSSTDSSTSSPATSTPSADHDQPDSISGGAIAGAVIGGLAGLAAILGLILFILRRRRTRKQHATSGPHMDKDKKSGTISPDYTQLGSPAPQYQTAEVEGSLGWSEMSGEGRGLLNGVKEMPDTSRRAEARELPG